MSVFSPVEVLRMLSSAKGAIESKMLNSAPPTFSPNTFTSSFEVSLKVGRKLLMMFRLNAGSQSFRCERHKFPFETSNPEEK